MTTSSYHSGQIIQEVNLSVEQGNSWNTSSSSFSNAGGDPAWQYDYSGNPYASFSPTPSPCRLPRVDFQAHYASSIITVQYTVSMRSDNSAGYARFRTFDLNANVRKSPNAYCGHSGYYENDGAWTEYTIRDAFIAGTTNVMKLEIQVMCASSGQIIFGWSGSDQRLMTVREIAK